MKKVCVIIYVCGVNTTSNSVRIVGDTDCTGGLGGSGDLGCRRPDGPGGYGGSGRHGDPACPVSPGDSAILLALAALRQPRWKR